MTKKQKVSSAVGRFFKNLFTKNIALKVIALLFSILLWGYVLSIENPEYTKHIRDVDISIVGEDVLNSRGLMLVTRDTGTTDVDILCRINKHSELDASRVTCVVDLSTRAISLDENEDSKTVTLDVQASVASDYGTVQSMTVSTVELEVARLRSRSNVRVTAKTIGSLPEGFTVELPTNLTISMRGQKSLLDKVARGEVTVDLDTFPVGDPATLADTYDRVLPVQFYDGSNILLQDIASSDGETFTVSVRVVVRAYKEVDIVPDIALTDEGYALDTVITSRKKVILYGDWSALSAMDSVTTTTIAATPDMHNTPVAADLIIPEGMETTAGFNKTITVTITVTEENDSKVVKVPISYSNIGEGLAKHADIPTTINVTLSGPRSAVEAFDESRLTANVDVSGYVAGTYTLPVVVATEGKVVEDLTFTPETDQVTVELITIE